MTRKLCLLLALAICRPAYAGGRVAWRTVERTYPVRFHPQLLPDRTETVTVRNVLLENEHLTIEVSPDLAGRVMHVTYRADGTELFNVMDWLMAWNVWDAGGWRVSFPFYEHGMRFQGQPAGWRALSNADGSVTLAMEMRFGRFRDAPELNYKGRFSHLRLSRAITLRPGQAFFECAIRAENPLPYRMGLRLWTTAQFPLADDAEFLFPVSRMCYHRAQRFSDWTGGEGQAFWRNWQLTNSYFSVNLGQPFVGVHYPSAGLSRLRIADPSVSPGAKLYGWAFSGKERQNARFFEIWTGLDRVFEQEGRFLPAFAAHGFTERAYVARGIGRVSYANEHAAVGLTHAKAGAKTEAVVRITPSHGIPEAEVTLYPDVRADQPIRAAADRVALRPLEVFETRLVVPAPEAPLRIVLRSRGRTLLDVTLPRAIAPKDAEFEAGLADSVRPSGTDPQRLAEHAELRGWLSPGREYATLTPAGIQAARELSTHRGDDAGACLLHGRIAYRLNELDEAAGALRKAIEIDAQLGEAHHLLGLVLLEQSKADDAARHFAAAVRARRSCAEAGHFVALSELAAGRPAPAAEALRQLLSARPGAVRPRLLLTGVLARLGRWKEAQALAVAMEAEDPASVEIAEVAVRAFPDDSARRGALAKLLENNPEADEALRRLRDEIDNGRWVHPPRPGPFRHISQRSLGILTSW